MCANVVSIQPVFLVFSLRGFRYSAFMASTRIVVKVTRSIESDHPDMKFDTITQVSKVILTEMDLTDFANISASKVLSARNDKLVLDL